MKNEFLHIRISEDLKEKLRQAAEADGRTLSNYVEWLVKQDIGDPRMDADDDAARSE